MSETLGMWLTFPKLPLPRRARKWKSLSRTLSMFPDGKLKRRWSVGVMTFFPGPNLAFYKSDGEWSETKHMSGTDNSVVCSTRQYGTSQTCAVTWSGLCENDRSCRIRCAGLERHPQLLGRDRKTLWRSSGLCRTANLTNHNCWKYPGCDPYPFQKRFCVL